MQQEQSNEATEKKFVFSRTFNAPREKVFKAWTEAEQLQQWWGPKGFKIDVKSLELRPGGMFHYSMELPTGDKMWGRFVYREILAPELIVYVNSFSDEQGGVQRPPFADKFPLEILNRQTFTEDNGKTTVSLEAATINGSAEEQQFYEGMFESMQQGFTGTLDQLEEYLAKQ